MKLADLVQSWRARKIHRSREVIDLDQPVRETLLRDWAALKATCPTCGQAHTVTELEKGRCPND